MAASKFHNFLLVSLLFALIFTPSEADSGVEEIAVESDNSEAFRIEVDILTSKIQSLESLIEKRNQELKSKDDTIAKKEKAIAEIEKTIKEKSDSVTSLESEVAKLEFKGLLDIKMNERKTIDLEQGWDFMKKFGITKLKNILEGPTEQQFSSEDYMILYTTIYTMCTQKPPHDYSQQLYDKYRETFEEYITSTVLPSLREKHDEFLLIELVRRWSNHKIMVQWLSRFFHYLDRYFIPHRSLPTLKEVGLTCFHDLVLQELHGNVRNAVISLIDQEREGEQIDRGLLKNVADIFAETGMGQMEYYESDYETSMLKKQ